MWIICMFICITKPQSWFLKFYFLNKINLVNQNKNLVWVKIQLMMNWWFFSFINYEKILRYWLNYVFEGLEYSFGSLVEFTYRKLWGGIHGHAICIKICDTNWQN